MFDKLISFCRYRVIRFGANYLYFGLLGIIYYPLSYWLSATFENATENIAGRITATIACFVLILSSLFTRLLGKYLALYWYLALLFCLPSLSIYMLLENPKSTLLLINNFIGLFLLALLVDSLMFVTILITGMVLGLAGYALKTNDFLSTDPLHTSMIISMNIFIMTLGVIFMRKKELSHQKITKENETLRSHIANKILFINSTSHEIKTLIHGLLNISGYLMEQWKKGNPNELYKFTKIITQNIHRLSELVSNILDFSHFNAGKFYIKPIPTDLIILIKEMISESKNLYLVDSNKHISLSFEHTELEEAPLEADPLRITQLLRNLYSNAIRFTDSDQATITAHLKQTTISYKDNSRESAYLFSLIDHGQGMSKSTLDEAFKIFIESNRLTTRVDHSGLGLAICKDIIEAHHGKIWAENNQDEAGCRISFLIPARFLGEKRLSPESTQETTLPTVVRENTLPPNAPPLPEKKRKLIVIIDDEKICLDSLRMLLESLGYDVVAKEGGVKGLKYLRRYAMDIDLVLLDLMMPDLYGLNILRELRLAPQKAHLPVILQTGATDKSEIYKATAFGILGVINKPYNKEEIFKLLSSIQF